MDEQSDGKQHADFRANAPPKTDLDNQANTIYNNLRLYADFLNGFTMLKDLRTAITYLPDQEAYLELRDINPDEESEVYYEKSGFTKEEISNGITSITRSRMAYPDSRRLGDGNLNRENSSRKYVAAQNGESVKVVREITPGQGEQTELSTEEALAMGTMQKLRKTVIVIADKFQGFDGFQKLLKKNNVLLQLEGINFVDNRGLILFNGGLDATVQRHIPGNR